MAKKLNGINSAKGQVKCQQKKPTCRDIAKLRQGNDMTQAALSRLMDVSVRTVSGWETGDRPPKDIGKLLAKIEKLILAESGNPAETISNIQEGKEEEQMWKDKYIKQLELNLKQQMEISALKEPYLT